MVNDESDNDEEKDYPSNLSELLQTAVNEDSTCHHLGLLSLNTVIWNLDVQVYLINSLNFQVIRHKYAARNITTRDNNRCTICRKRY